MQRSGALVLAISILIPGVAAANDYSAYYRFSPSGFFLKSLEPRDGGLALIFADSAGRTITPKVSINGTPVEPILRLPKDPEPRIYEYTIQVSNGPNSPEQTIELRYHPRALFAKSGNSMPGNIGVKSSTIPVGVTAMITPRTYNAEDLEWGRKRWQTDARSDMERAEATVRSIMLGLRDSVGVPSDKMGELPPRGQYERASSGVDQVWCSQFAQILHFALTSIGIEARVVRTAPPCQRVGDLCFHPVEGHATVEYFSRERKSWIWIDPSIGVLRATAGNAPLNLNQVIQALDTPLERELRFKRFDPVRKKTLSVTTADPKISGLTKTYLRPGVLLTF